MSSRPNAFRIFSIAACTSSSLRASHTTASPCAPASFTIRTVSCSFDSARPVTTQSRHRLQKWSAMDCPMPSPPPVTSTTLPANFPSAAVAMNTLHRSDIPTHSPRYRSRWRVQHLPIACSCQQFAQSCSHHCGCSKPMQTGCNGNAESSSAPSASSLPDTIGWIVTCLPSSCA